MVGQPMRFMPFQQVVFKSLTAGKLGVPGLLRIHHWRSTNDRECGDANHEDKQIGESVVIHEVDLACWFFDAAPDTVYAVGRGVTNGVSLEYTQVHLGFPDGGMALIDCTNQLTSSSCPYYSLSMIGSTGAAYADDHYNMNLLFRDGNPTALNVGQGHDYVRLQLQEFINAIQDDREPLTTGEDGRRAMAVAQAAARSLASHRRAQRVGERYE